MLGHDLGDGRVVLVDRADERLDQSGQALDLHGTGFDEGLVAGEIDSSANEREEFLAALFTPHAMLFQKGLEQRRAHSLEYQ